MKAASAKKCDRVPAPKHEMSDKMMRDCSCSQAADTTLWQAARD